MLDGLVRLLDSYIWRTHCRHSKIHIMGTEGLFGCRNCHRNYSHREIVNIVDNYLRCMA
jgi:hypothetical protein